VSLAGLSTCAVVFGGEVYCWGDNASGQLGDGVSSRRYGPEKPAERFSYVRQIAAGDDFVCALLTNGHVVCRGGQHDDGAEHAYQHCDHDPMCFDVIEGIDHATRIAGWGNAFCATLNDGRARCWRYEAKSAGSSAQVWSRRLARALPLVGVKDVAVGETLTCALLLNEEVWCRPEVDVFAPAGTTDSERTPFVQIHGLGRTRALVAADQHACALSDEGTVGCFYHAGDGVLRGWPYGEPGRISRVLGIRDVVHIATGESHACAIDAGGRVGCWGLGHRGQVGTTRPLPYGMDWARTALPVAWP
jgi:alpha-tubulin suppressor-like RCC1 family protein